MPLEIRSPFSDKTVISIPDETARLSRNYSGTICSADGDEFTIEQNVIDLIAEPKSYSLAQSSNHWTVTAKLYEDLWRKRSLSILTGEPFPVEKEKELLLKWSDPKPGNLYLDVGCSTALYARLLKKAEPGCNVVALDFSKAMLREARVKAEADEADLYLVRADAREMPFFAKAFDGLVMGGTLNELSDPMKVLYECRRVIKPGSIFFMMHLVDSERWVGRMVQQSAGIGGIHFWSMDESNKMFEQAGFKPDEQFAKGIVCFTRLIAV